MDLCLAKGFSGGGGGWVAGKGSSAWMVYGVFLLRVRGMGVGLGLAWLVFGPGLAHLCAKRK